MLDTHGPYIVAAYIPCQNCSAPCVVTARFAAYPDNDALDRHVFQTTCDDCGQIQTRVGRDAFQRTIVEWTLEARSPRQEDVPQVEPTE